ncbi:MAG: NUDIX hydrolase [Jatrophihabitantaceae bacterium]
MRWSVESERNLYQDDWLQLRMADVVLPDGRHLDHRLVRCSDGAYAALVSSGRVLLMWRHRFITDAWGWEVPGGAIDAGEEPVAAAAREFEEETGWRPDSPLRPLVRIDPSPGLMTTRHHIFQLDSATYIGPPEHGFESDRIAWIALDEALALIDKGDIIDANTVTALLYLLNAR